MTDEQLKEASFFAKLASIRDPGADLEPESGGIDFPYHTLGILRVELEFFLEGRAQSFRKEFVTVIEERLGLDQLNVHARQGLREELLGLNVSQRVLGESSGRVRRRKQSILLDHALPIVLLEVRHVLGRLLNGREVTFLEIEHGVPVFGLGDEGILHERPLRDEFSGAVLGQFLRLLRVKPLPFRICPSCSTVFVRIRRQLFCTQDCQTQSYEQSRKERKKEYMKSYWQLPQVKRRRQQKTGVSRKRGR